MTITNKKLIKNFKNILSSSIAAKEIVQAEIDKVDEKYRKLAEAEKVELNRQMTALNIQIENYSALVGESTEETEATATEEKVTDTIFPENNEVDAVDESEKTSAPEDDEDNIFKDALEVEDAAEVEASQEEEDLEVAEEAVAQEEDEWPDVPQEW